MWNDKRSTCSCAESESSRMEHKISVARAQMSSLRRSHFMQYFTQHEHTMCSASGFVKQLHKAQVAQICSWRYFYLPYLIILNLNPYLLLWISISILSSIPTEFLNKARWKFKFILLVITSPASLKKLKSNQILKLALCYPMTLFVPLSFCFH